MTLRSTMERVIIIDTPGLDDGRNEQNDEAFMVNLFNTLSKIQNIYCVLILIKRNEILTKSFKKLLLDYKQMLNSKKEKELFCAVMTHCDVNIEFNGDPLILNEIENNCIE